MYRQPPLKLSNFADSPRIDIKDNAIMVDRDLSHLFLYVKDIFKIPHMMQSDSTTQSIANINNAQLVTFDTDVHHNFIERTSSSRFTIKRLGSYLIAISGIADTSVGANKHIEIWLRVNGSDIALSNTRVELVASIETVVAVTFMQHFEVDDYFEFWTWGDATSCRWLATAAGVNPTRPATPSIKITCNFIGLD